MAKDILISFLTATQVAERCFTDCKYDIKNALIIGIAVCVFIFLLFLEDLWEKWRNYRKRVRRVKEYVGMLRSMRPDWKQTETDIFMK